MVTRGADPVMPPLIRWRAGRGPEMDRRELRFRILFEYYSSLHSSSKYDANAKIKAIDAEDGEKQAAKIWLIDEGIVNGEMVAHIGMRHRPSITRINSRGINFVEAVMDSAFTEIGGKDDSFDSLDKPDKIKRFVAECLNGPTTGSLCKATFDAIVAIMEQVVRRNV